MTIQKLSGYLLIVSLFLTHHLCSAGNGQNQRRYLYNVVDDNCGCQQGRCVRFDNGAFRCDCYTKDWVGDRCDTLAWTLTQVPDTPKPHTETLDYACSLHGKLTSTGCVCYDNWTGHICQFVAPHSDHCNNDCVHGSCVGHKNQQGYIDYHHCECDYGWYGDHCTHQYGAPGTQHLDHCNNDCVHGSCVGHTNQHGFIDYYHCECDNGWYGGYCTYSYGVQPDSSSSTSISARTTTAKTTTGPSTTTSIPKHTTVKTTLPSPSATSSKTLATSVKTSSAFSNCDHSAVLTAIAQQTQTVNQNAAECSPGSHTSHDALVLTNCAVPQNPSSWQHGVNVMSYCGGTAHLPTYTPIAAFDNGIYSPKGSLSGIFLGCTNTGFKIVVQSCGQPPHITEIALGGTNTQNPNTYYTIF